MQISAAFDGGNVRVLDASDPGRVRLAIVEDAGGEHYQWFYFRVCGARDRELRLCLENAGGASYPDGWVGYQAVASYDRRHHFRVPTRYESGRLVIEHRPVRDTVYYSYFAPYSGERHHDLIARMQCREGVRHEVLGRSVDGRDIDLLVVSGRRPDGAAPPKRAWIWARQHPGETMAEWLVEGLLEALVCDADPVARALLDQVDFYVVPNVNPDGSARGHLRCNAVGANLNREWRSPSAERSPEVLCLQQKMLEVGVDFGLDVHGDEALPYNFISGIEGIPSLSPEQRALARDHCAALLAASPDFQTRKGYPVTPPGRANLAMGANWVGERFGCLAMTLEMPFKDTADRPHPEGWSPERAKRFGRDQLVALLGVVERLVSRDRPRREAPS